MFDGLPGFNMVANGMDSQNPQESLLNPKTLGLLGLAAALSKASGPSRLPQSFGQVASQGLLGGVQGYQQGQQFQQQEMADAAKKNFATQFPQYAQLYALDPKTALERAYPKAGEAFGKVDPKDYTPESVAAFARSNNFADLVKRPTLHFADTGAGIQPLNQDTGAPVGAPIAKGMTPDATANLNFRKFEFANLSKNQQGQLGAELARLGISQQQLQEGRIQLVTDADGQIHLVNKMTGVGTNAVTPSGEPLKVSKPLTETQGKANLFGTRAEEADNILQGLETKISTTGLAAKRGLENIPGVGGILGTAGNAMLSGDQQKVEQAQRNFVNAVLRVESGAAISKDEFDNAIKQYFPRPGDTSTVIEQKRQNRATAIAGLKAMGSRSGASPVQPAGQPAGQQKASAHTVNWSDLGR